MIWEPRQNRPSPAKPMPSITSAKGAVEGTLRLIVTAIVGGCIGTWVVWPAIRTIVYGPPTYHEMAGDPDPRAPQPQTADGHRNWSGVAWRPRDVFGFRQREVGR